ncbi:MAG TPA: L-serine ammonia-lyase, iron-sulfur-dependent subunit beta [Candidatus Gracilibacteria bacterium]|nr:L-serine ammonia-lyase, iron-sulfur-dependent subunit beta [Candidatus Gracilibacteria bacterium]
MAISLLAVSGPEMVGPSSSHTAGALKIGQFARSCVDFEPERVEIFLHGSFGTVYKGHATDRALIAGILGMRVDDENIRNAFEIAKAKPMEYTFIPCSLGMGFHPNTAKIRMYHGEDKFTIIGSSIGGGAIKISNINGFDVNINENEASNYIVVILHKDFQGVLTEILASLSDNNNIAAVHSMRMAKTGEVLTIIESDEEVGERKIASMKQNHPYINSIFEIK